MEEPVNSIDCDLNILLSAEESYKPLILPLGAVIHMKSQAVPEGHSIPSLTTFPMKHREWAFFLLVKVGPAAVELGGDGAV